MPPSYNRRTGSPVNVKRLQPKTDTVLCRCYSHNCRGQSTWDPKTKAAIPGSFVLPAHFKKHTQDDRLRSVLLSSSAEGSSSDTSLSDVDDLPRDYRVSKEECLDDSEADNSDGSESLDEVDDSAREADDHEDVPNIETLSIQGRGTAGGFEGDEPEVINTGTLSA